MPEPAYSFGHFRLVPSRRELLAAGQPLNVGGRAFDLLTALVQGGGRVMSKDELMSLTWPRLVVEENNLKVQIVTLRKLLGHPAIGTVPGRGYRFALPITQDNATANAVTPGEADEARIPASGVSGSPGPVTLQLRGNLPAQLLPLIGRSDDLAAIRSLLLEHGLVTVSGAGGIGKTRLSQAVAARSASDYPDGVWWIELAPFSQANLVATTIAETLRIDLSDGRDPTQAVLAHARGRRLLLVLDNCEHLLEAVASFAAAACGAALRLRLLVTSQEVLRIPSEQVYRLGPLTLPEPGVNSSVAAVTASGAGALFLARARAADSRFELSASNCDAVIEICRRLDGIPLAIELAVARLPLLGIEGCAPD